MDAGADPYAVDAQGSSVLLTAVNASAVDAARALLVSSQVAADFPRLFVACPTEDKTTALIQAVKMADIGTLFLSIFLCFLSPTTTDFFL